MLLQYFSELSDSEGEGPSTSPIRVRFQRPETERQKKRREQSSAYRSRLIEQDPWIQVDVTSAKVEFFRHVIIHLFFQWHQLFYGWIRTRVVVEPYSSRMFLRSARLLVRMPQTWREAQRKEYETFTDSIKVLVRSAFGSSLMCQRQLCVERASLKLRSSS